MRIAVVKSPFYCPHRMGDNEIGLCLYDKQIKNCSANLSNKLVFPEHCKLEEVENDN